MQNVKLRAKIGKFQEVVGKFYMNNRRDMPWRNTRDPYKILVSEVMLQQTQVSRVLEKYPKFIKRFPTVATLARAPLSAVLREWSGLGYNRRAKFLKQAAEQIVNTHHGHVPSTLSDLIRLPGVGESTAGGILAFAYNIPIIFIETNIRRVFLHHFFRNKRNVSDSEILPLVEKTLDHKNPREWYYALFDYGTHLATTIPTNPNKRSRHYMRQSTFLGSTREARGKILRCLMVRPCTRADLSKSVGLDIDKTARIINSLRREGFIERSGRRYVLK